MLTGSADVKCCVQEACKAAKWYPQLASEAFQQQSYNVVAILTNHFLVPKTSKINLESLQSLEKASTWYADDKCRFQEACKAANNSHSKPALSDAFQQQSYNAPSNKQNPTTNQHPESFQAPKKPQLVTKTSNDTSKRLAKLPTDTANHRWNPLKISSTMHTYKHQMVMQTLNVASKWLARQISVDNRSAAATAVLQCPK